MDEEYCREPMTWMDHEQIQERAILVEPAGVRTRPPRSPGLGPPPPPGRIPPQGEYFETLPRNLP
jgi:hypothetical protein